MIFMCMNNIFLLIILGVATVIIFGTSDSNGLVHSQQKVVVKPNEIPAFYDKISSIITIESSKFVYGSQNMDMDKSGFLFTSLNANNSGNNTNNTGTALPDEPSKNPLQQFPNNNNKGIRCNPLNYDPSICHLGPTIP
jgi:hypothetical protein